MPSIKISGDLTATDIEEIMMTTRAIERRNPKKQITMLIDNGPMTQMDALGLLERMLSAEDEYRQGSD